MLAVDMGLTAMMLLSVVVVGYQEVAAVDVVEDREEEEADCC